MSHNRKRTREIIDFNWGEKILIGDSFDLRSLGNSLRFVFLLEKPQNFRSMLILRFPSFQTFFSITLFTFGSHDNLIWIFKALVVMKFLEFPVSYSIMSKMKQPVFGKLALYLSLYSTWICSNFVLLIPIILSLVWLKQPCLTAYYLEI